MTFSRPGAIDLSGLGKPAAPPAGAAAPAGGAAASGFAIDVAEANFEQVVTSSMSWIVVLALWSPRAPASRDFTDVLVRAADAYDGAIQIGRVDIDTNVSIAQALQVRGVPVALALVQGRPVPLFQGTADPADVARYFDELVKLAAQAGVTGRAPGASSAAEPDDEPVVDPRFAEADAAYAAGDFDGAVAALERLQAQYPADAEVAERLGGTRLMQRVDGADLQAARKAAADAPDDLDAQLLVADLDVTGGHIDDAFDRLLLLLPRLTGDDKDRARERLLELFTVVGNTDPRVSAARRRLATALF